MRRSLLLIKSYFFYVIQWSLWSAPLFALTAAFYPVLIFGDKSQSQFPEVTMEGVNDSIPELQRMALYRINQYRKAAGLPLWIYDESLSRMGQKHADYVLLNCKAGRATGGHFEQPEYPGYSNEGDEAARTSGLSGGPDPLYGLELLMAGVYHRKQFLVPEAMRVGVGFSYDSDSHCSSTLFVSRPLADNASIEGGSSQRFSVFPSSGFQDTLLVFKSETPDPRPRSGQGKNSGYPVTVCMKKKDADLYRSTVAKLLDGKGNRVQIWVSDPAHPFTRSAPKRIYAPDKGDTSFYFSKNAYCVFLMPVKPLKAGENYSVDLTMNIAGKTESLSWSFATRGQTIWKVTGNSESEQLSFAATHASAGDTVHFSAGLHQLPRGQWLPDRAPLFIKGEGMGRTFLRTSQGSDHSAYLFNLFKGEYEISDLTYEGNEGGLFFAQPGSSVNLRRVEIKHAPFGAIYLTQGSSMRISESRFVDIGTPDHWSFCFSRSKERWPAARVILEKNNYFEKIHKDVAACGAGFESDTSRVWEASPHGDISGGVMSLDDLLRIVPENETIELKKGEYHIQDRIWITRNLRLKGDSAMPAIKVETGEKYAFNVKEHVSMHISGIHLLGGVNFLYLRPRSQAVFSDSVVESEGKGYFSVIEEGGSLELRRVDFRKYGSPFFAYLRNKKPSPKLLVGEGVSFSEVKPRNAGRGIIEGFPD